ncbi:MAG: hypothetical protein NTZ65_04240 [Candidatus Berkelbacteria bacterium]|nr:hypothetical protein [Candidatus Berkelbacteria bacterium]
MNKILAALIIILSLTVPFSSVLADGKLTNFPVGSCKTINGGMWQQLSDGTWADPNDKINTCKLGGAGGIGNQNYNAWTQAGYTQNQLGNMTYQQWFNMCVLTQSLVARPECQNYNGSNYYGNGGYGGYNNNSGYNNALWYPEMGRATNSFFYSDDNLAISAQIPAENTTVSSILAGVAMGWMFNQWTK